MEDMIYIGKKPLVSYILAITTQASKKEKIKIKARGKLTSKAIDISQIALNNHLKDWDISNIKIGTEELQTDKEEKDTTNVSFIEIEMSKK